MKSLNKIIKEEYIKFLKENYDDNDVDWNYFEEQDDIKANIFRDFLYNNNPTFTKHIPWKVIPFLRLKKIWEDYMKFGFVRDTKGVEIIEKIMVENTVKINVITTLLGHTSQNPDEDYKEYIDPFIDEQIRCYFQKPVDKNQLQINFKNPSKGYIKPKGTKPCDVHPFIREFIEENITENMNVEDIKNKVYDEITNRFTWDYTEDPKSGQAYISDFGLTPLLTLVSQLRNERKPENILVIIDRMLNVAHQRSDLANWFVEGGSHALSQLSGYGDTGEDSSISGSYKLSDYK